MEQQLIDTAKYKIHLQSLDSRFADYHDANNSGFKLTLIHPLKNIMRVRLASIELPLVEYLFSEQYGNLTMAVGVGTAGFKPMKPLIPGNYCADLLIQKINENLKLIHPGFSCEMNSINGQCTIKNATEPFELYMFSYKNNIAKRKNYWGLGYYLGFREGRVTAKPNIDGSYSVTGPSVVNIQQNQYYLLQLYYPDSVVNVIHRTEDDGYIEAFAKLVLKEGYFTIAFDDNSNLLRKEFTFLAPVTIPQFTLKLLNQYGEPVNMLGVEWSVTVEVTEITNSKTYTTLSRTYANK